MAKLADLLDAIRQVESSGNNMAVSRVGAKGPYQFMPKTAEEFGLKGNDVFDEPKARAAAQKKITGLLDTYGGNVEHAVAAYNLGEGNMAKLNNEYHKVPETKNYVQKVLSMLNPISSANADEKVLSEDEWNALKQAPKQQDHILSEEEWTSLKQNKPMTGTTGSWEAGPITRFTNGIGGQLLGDAAGLTGSDTLQAMADEGNKKATGFAGGAGQFVGSTLPYLALPGGGIAKTALQSAALAGATTNGDLEERAKQAALTGAFSGVGGLAGKLIGGFKPSEGAKQLMKEGVQPTLGQGIDKSNILGKSIGMAEEAVKSTPIVGQIAAHARNRANDEWTKAIVKKAELPALGISAEGKAGHEAIDTLQKSYSKAYDANLKPFDIPKTTTLASNILSIVRQNPAIEKPVMRELKSLGRSNTMNAADVHRVAGALRDTGSRYEKSLLASEQDLGAAYKEVADTLRSYMVSKLPIDNATALKAIDTNYGLFKTMQKAASSVAAEDGKFSGTQLYNAVKASDKMKDKSAFARGKARLQEDAKNAKFTLGDKLNESGTAPRAAMMGALVGGGAVINPASLAAIPLGYLGSMRPVQKALLGGYKGQKALSKSAQKTLGSLLAGSVNKKEVKNAKR